MAMTTKIDPTTTESMLREHMSEVMRHSRDLIGIESVDKIKVEQGRRGAIKITFRGRMLLPPTTR